MVWQKTETAFDLFGEKMNLEKDGKLRFDMRLRRKEGLEHLLGVVEDF